MRGFVRFLQRPAVWAVFGGLLFVAAPAGGLLAESANRAGLAELLGMRSPGERMAGAKASKLPLSRIPASYRVKSGMRTQTLDDPETSLPEDLAEEAVIQEPEAPFEVAEMQEPPLRLSDDLTALPAPARPSVIVTPVRFDPGRPGNPGGPGDPGGTVPVDEPPLTPIPAIPEPAVWLTMLAGFGIMGMALRAAGRRGASSGFAQL